MHYVYLILVCSMEYDKNDIQLLPPTKVCVCVMYLGYLIDNYQASLQDY